MDITDALAPNSDQLDAVDLVGGPQTFTVERVTKGADGRINVFLKEFPRPWRPSKGMLRAIAAPWGTDSTKWVGRRLTLFCEPTVKWAGVEVGGIRVSHVSDIGTPVKVPLILGRTNAGTKIVQYTVEPLREAPKPKTAPARDWEPLLAMVDSIPDMDTLRTVHQQEGIASAPEHVQDAFMARKGELEAQ